MTGRLKLLPLFVFSLVLSSFAQAEILETLGNPEDQKIRVRTELVMIGGGELTGEILDAFANATHGGDVLVIRANDDMFLSEELYQTGRYDSVHTWNVESEHEAGSKKGLALLKNAEAVFLAGGDQWKYFSRWKNTPLMELLNLKLEKGLVLGGTSAGLAVLGEYIYTAENGSVESDEALRDPFDSRITLGRDLLQIPALRNFITDSHFSQRNRLGRLKAFVARASLEKNEPVNGIGIDEATALHIDSQEHARVLGEGFVTIIEPNVDTMICEPGRPLRLEARIKRYPRGTEVPGPRKHRRRR